MNDEAEMNAPDLMTKLKSLTKAEEDEALINELNRLLNKGVIDHKLYHKARKVWEI